MDVLAQVYLLAPKVDVLAKVDVLVHVHVLALVHVLVNVDALVQVRVLVLWLTSTKTGRAALLLRCGSCSAQTSK